MKSSSLLLVALALSLTTGCATRRQNCPSCGHCQGCSESGPACDSGACSTGCAGGSCGGTASHWSPDGFGKGSHGATGDDSLGGNGWQGAPLEGTPTLNRQLAGRGMQRDAHVARMQRQPSATGPASPAVAYPYYTTRAPRDFLMDNPPSIGN